MYPSGELAALAERKRALQARIDVRRWECAEAAAELARPLATLDRGLALWRRIAPTVKMFAVPLGWFVARFVMNRARRGKLSSVLSMLPLILRGARMVLRMRVAR